MPKHLENRFPGPLGSPIGWHNVSSAVAQIAERTGFSVRPNPTRQPVGWQVWGTDTDIAAFKEQAL